jgi:hypothetical protein
VLLQQYLFADRRRIARIITGARHEPVLTRTILDWLAGRVPYARAKRAVLRRAPLFAARLAWNAIVTRRLA